MANSKIKITINNLPSENDSITIADTIDGIAFNMLETFKTTRSNLYESQIGNSVNECAYYLSQALSLDYNNLSIYSIKVIDNEIVINSSNEKSIFSEASNTTGGDVTVNITNATPPEVFTIDELTISEASINACDNFEVSVETNNQADNITSPISQSINSNPFVFELQRSSNLSIITLDRNNITATQSIRVPLLLASYFDINIVSTPSNGAINVTKKEPLTLSNLLVIEYSLDNTNWFSSGYFNNLDEGDYTLYIRDNIGCKVTKSFSISEFTPNLLDYNSLCEISNLNSIRYKENVTWNDYVLKTPFNTLSFEENVKLPNKSFTQLFVKDDIVTTQIKTNYETVTAKLIDNEGNETSLLVEKKTDNMNIYDVRDGVVDSVSYNNSSYTGIKFSGGKTYNSSTLEETGDYNIGENVPEWINKDDYINVEGVGWYKVLDIIYSDDAYTVCINLLVNDFPYSTPKTLKITSVYNAVDYENYEFVLNCSALEGFYKLEVNATDSSFGSKQFVSEWLNIKEQHLNTVLIECYNSENNEINYNTGIKHKMRLKLAEDLKWKSNSEIEVYVTDTNTVNLDTKYRGFWDLSAYPLPTIMAEKLVLMLLQDRLFIDTVNYICEGEPESTPIGSQYQIKANLVKSDYVYELYSGKGEITINADGIPLSINQAGGFLLVE
jgi:hypothetical protein